MSRYTITPVGWQYYLRQDGVIVSTHDTIQEAQAAKRQEESKP